MRWFALSYDAKIAAHRLVSPVLFIRSDVPQGHGVLQVLAVNMPDLSSGEMRFQPRPLDGFYDGTVTFRQAQYLLSNIVPKLVEKLDKKQHPCFYFPPFATDELPL